MNSTYFNDLPVVFVSHVKYPILSNFFSCYFKTTMAAKVIHGKNYKTIIPFYNTTINLCKFGKGLIGNFLIQILYKDALKYSNYTASCPLKKVKVMF